MEYIGKTTIMYALADGELELELQRAAEIRICRVVS